MAFVGPFPLVANAALRAALPPTPGVPAVAAGAAVPPITDIMLDNARMHTQMVISATGSRSTVREGTAADYKLHELYIEKRAREGQ
jgi:hypothetical protein